MEFRAKRLNNNNRSSNNRNNTLRMLLISSNNCINNSSNNSDWFSNRDFSSSNSNNSIRCSPLSSLIRPVYPILWIKMLISNTQIPQVNTSSINVSNNSNHNLVKSIFRVKLTSCKKTEMSWSRKSPSCIQISSRCRTLQQWHPLITTRLRPFWENQPETHTMKLKSAPHCKPFLGELQRLVPRLEDKTYTLTSILTFWSSRNLINLLLFSTGW